MHLKSPARPIKEVGTDSFSAHQILGAGSFGEVFLVERKNDKRLLAMKVLLKKNIIAKNLVQYAHAERNIMASIRHPFIVPLCYAFQTEERLFLVTEYCQGGDLS